MSDPSASVVAIKPSFFYGNYEKIQKKIDTIDNMCNSQLCSQPNIKNMPRRLMGPTQFWSVFYKQADALDAAYENSNNYDPLCTLVYQKADGHRIFVVAHPEVYWWSFINNIDPKRRCAYEVIPDGAPCCLYLDLEYGISLNPDKNGIEMTQTLIEILSAYISKFWGIKCDKKNVINLDSSTKEKFSKHLIFRIKDIAFKDNYHVGRLMKSIVAEIEEFLASNGSSFHDVLSYVERQHLEELFIETEKRPKIFIDTAVYTRNRHFRIYKATKFNKNSHLEIAKECEYQLIKENKDKQLEFFLESLISYFPDKSDLVLLEFNKDCPVGSQRIRDSQICRPSTQDRDIPSPYPFIDKFILQLVEPGNIRLTKYFEQSQIIVYDIAGNRYCANVQRQHKSNGIYWVVDLKNKIAYQKCHDEDDCPGFRSTPIILPPEILFQLDDDDDELFDSISMDAYDSSTSLNPDSSI